jgi:hypothetical protein
VGGQRGEGLIPEAVLLLVSAHREAHLEDRVAGAHQDLCATYGDRHREAALENNLADLHPRRRADDATRLPEIWKPVSW